MKDLNQIRSHAKKIAEIAKVLQTRAGKNNEEVLKEMLFDYFDKLEELITTNTEEGKKDLFFRGNEASFRA